MCLRYMYMDGPLGKKLKGKTRSFFYPLLVKDNTNYVQVSKNKIK